MIISTRNLSFTYPNGARALNKINLEIGQGMFGLLGPNGAGKSTLLRILATLLTPVDGRAVVGGFDLADSRQRLAVRQALGYLPQETGLYPNLNPVEFLEYMAVLKNINQPDRRRAEVERVIALLGLESAAYTRLGRLSGGMQRRVCIAQALLGDPPLLVIDEPTSGLDPQERSRLRSLLTSLAPTHTILFSTHIVEDLAAGCSGLGVLREGSLRFWGAPAELAQAGRGQCWELKLPHGADVKPEWKVASAAEQEGCLSLRITGTRPHPEAVQAEPTLEEGYLVVINN